MPTSTHSMALFEEGFALVEVAERDVHAVGQQTVYEAIQNHPWIIEQELPVVVVFPTSDGIQAYGDDELVEAVTSMDFDSIVWGHELTLEWDDA